MDHKVMLWRKSTSRQPDVERVAPRTLDIDDAIRFAMQERNLGYVSVALAYPTDKDKEDIGPEHWRRRVRCLMSGEYSSLPVSLEWLLSTDFKDQLSNQFLQVV